MAGRGKGELEFRALHHPRPVFYPLDIRENQSKCDGINQLRGKVEVERRKAQNQKLRGFRRGGKSRILGGGEWVRRSGVVGEG